MRASMPEFSKRLRLLDPCFRDIMCIMASRKRACGMVPRLGPAGFSLVIVCRGTGCTPDDEINHKEYTVCPYVAIFGTCTFTQLYIYPFAHTSHTFSHQWGSCYAASLTHGTKEASVLV